MENASRDFEISVVIGSGRVVSGKGKTVVEPGNSVVDELGSSGAAYAIPGQSGFGKTS